jgi:hypothetical protein
MSGVVYKYCRTSARPSLCVPLPSITLSSIRREREMKRETEREREEGR